MDKAFGILKIVLPAGRMWASPSLGRAEALEAGKLLKEGGYIFDVAYTSVLKRAIHTLWIVLQEMNLEWIPVTNAWQVNERHYGTLQGLNKSEMAEKFGEEQVKIWRRSYDIPLLPWNGRMNATQDLTRVTLL